MSSGIDGGQLDLSGVRWLPGGARLAALAQAELPQKAGLAGPFTVLAAVRAAGFDVADQDEVALAAGGGRGPAEMPDGEAARTDFRLPLPENAPDPAGLARAVETLSGGLLQAIPVTGEWEPDTLFDLLAALWDLPRVAVIAHVDAAEFGAHDTPDRALQDYLDTGVPPLWTSRWRPRSHFVLPAGVRIGAEGTCVSVVDTYRSLGDNGIHDQPLEWLSAALYGVLLVVDTPQTRVAREAIRYAGLDAVFWDRR